MGLYSLRRLLASVVTGVIASMLVFLLVRAVPGDVVAQMLGQTSDETAARTLRAFFGLDQPLWQQLAVSTTTTCSFTYLVKLWPVCWLLLV